MPSRTSRPRPSPPSPWKEERGCDERRVEAVAAELARELKRGDRVILEGPMGAGKSTFARALLRALGVRQPPEGSPTFAIAHEYDSPRGGVVHIDFYRIRGEAEIEDAGIPAYLWERDPIVIMEWLSMFEGFAADVIERSPGRGCWRVDLSPAAADTRDLVILRA